MGRLPGRQAARQDCASADIKNYDFGLVCVDKAGIPAIPS